MLVLFDFDNGMPRNLAHFLVGHFVEEARARGWDVLVTTDESIRYQQNLKIRKIALVVLGHQQWPIVKLVTADIVAAVNTAKPGSYIEVDAPFRE